MTAQPNDGRLLGEPRPNSLVGAFILSYLLAGLVYGLLVWAGTIWNQLANTRLLDLLYRGGVVQLTDADAGFIAGAPDIDLLVAARSPVDWLLVLGAIGLFLVFWAVKSIQFRGIAEFVGIEGTTGEHARTFMYGLGLNRFLPYNVGNHAMAEALRAKGATTEQAALSLFLTQGFVVIEIVIFAVIGLVLVGFAAWIGMLFWASAIALTAYLVVFGRRKNRTAPSGLGLVGHTRLALGALVARPRAAFKLTILSVIAFAVEDLAAFTIAMAFSSSEVILHPDTSMIIMALVAGYIARFIPLTPGGIGQFEWGFAAALYVGGMGMPEAVTIAILDNVIRYVAGSGVWGAVVLGYGSGTSLRSVFDTIRPAGVEATEEATA